MKKSICLSLFFLWTILPNFAQVKVIFDTDFGGDADDLGALAMLHHFVDRQEACILAVMCWSTETNAVAGIDAVNHFYGHPTIPIGVRKGEPHTTAWNHTKILADHLPHDLTNESAPDATLLYRQLLAANDDHSIVIVITGPMMNLQKLIQSPADAISPLSGKELMDKKVKEFVIMGGQFPSGKNEWNFNGDMPGVTQFVIKNIERPIIFSGFEVGVAIKTGDVFNGLEKDHPLYLGFKHFSEHAPWMKENYTGQILDNSTFDQTAILYAIRKGIGSYWERIEGGYCLPDEKGGNQWISGQKTNHSYLKLRRSTKKMETLIEALMLNE